VTVRDSQNSRARFGAFGGVFTPCILTILGVILFMRADFVLGQAGILRAMAILVIAKSISLFTSLSASAIATNMDVRGGGAYFLISRVLGPEFGGAIGVVLFLAQAVSVPFYILGFTEALTLTFPALQPYTGTVALATAAALFVITLVGADWAIRVQYVIMATLGLSILAFFGGAALRFSPETFSANWSRGYTLLDTASPAGGSYTFWRLFAIYFPAVTGIMAGINMSGDLKEPGKAIPRGVLAAVFVGFLVYIAQLIVCGGAFAREDLIDKPYLVLTQNALFGAGFMVTAGMFAATLSSALGSFMGAPRVLQAVARDRILPGVGVFARGAKKSDEPRRALVFTGVLTAIVLVWAGNAGEGEALNLVAKTITMFFLYTYGMLNVAAFIEIVGGNPSFRPRFRYFNWMTALAGGLGCVAVAFIISPPEAVGAVVLLAGLVWYLQRRQLRTTFGDARWGLVYKATRNNLIRLARMRESSRNWRPTCLVFSGNPDTRETLVRYAGWIEADQGVVFLANILVGEMSGRLGFRKTAAKQLADFCDERGIWAFPVVVADEDLEHGMEAVLQIVGVGPLRPNLVVFGWSDEVERVRRAVEHYRLAQRVGMSVLVVHPSGRSPEIEGQCVDVWWRGRKNGGLMVLLAHLLTRNWEWRGAHVRLLRQVANEAAREGTLRDLRNLIKRARIDAEPYVVLSDRPFEEVLKTTSADADCIVLGFEIPESGDEAWWYERCRRFLMPGPTTILVCSASDEDLLA